MTGCTCTSTGIRAKENNMQIKNLEQSTPFIDALGVGAPLVDQILHVAEEMLASMPGIKGGMAPVDFSTFTKHLQEIKVIPKLIPGGSCANVLRGLSRLGHSCAFFGKIGHDSVGDFFLQDLTEFGIKSFCVKSSTPTGQVLAFITPDGERTFQSYLGAALDINAENLDPANFAHVKVVHIEGYSLVYPNLAQRTVKYAKAAGATVSLDLASFEIINARRTEFIDLIKSGVDICFGNEGEIKALTDLAAREGCEYLKEICVTAVATMGKNGCWVGHKNEMIFSPSIPIENPLDTTGAGDLFISGFLHGYLYGKPLNICAHYGALAGSAVVQVEGARLNESQWQTLRKQMHET